MAQGLALFDTSASGGELSQYHVEAAIAVAHVSAPSFAETDWSTVVGLYDRTSGARLTVSGGGDTAAAPPLTILSK